MYARSLARPSDASLTWGRMYSPPRAMTSATTSESSLSLPAKW